MHLLRVFSRARTRVCLRLRTNKYYSMAFAILPSIAGGLALELLTEAENAWEVLLDACVTCTNRCISGKDNYAPMFNEKYEDL